MKRIEKTLADPPSEAPPNLQDRYKPLGLKAVVAATMRTKAAQPEADRSERVIPAALSVYSD